MSSAPRLCVFVIIHIVVVDASTVLQSPPIVSKGVKVGNIDTGKITEASGICASRRHPHVLYTHNDSGDTNRIFAIDATSGHRIATITINGAEFTDWEDIACGPCPGEDGPCVYIADTGGGAANTIYRIREPDTLSDSLTVKLESSLKFSWDQPDCETLMVDNRGEVYVVSKVNDGRGRLVHLPSDAWGNENRTLVEKGVFLPFNTNDHGPVGGDISMGGDEVLIKTYKQVVYWYVPDGDYYGHLKTFHDALNLPYHHEVQGEAVCWDAAGDGYYTLGEGKNPPLYYYPRTNGTLGNDHHSASDSEEVIEETVKL